MKEMSIQKEIIEDFKVLRVKIKNLPVSFRKLMTEEPTLVKIFINFNPFFQVGIDLLQDQKIL